MARSELKRIIDLIPTPVFLRCSDGRFIMANRAMLDIAGIEGRELKGEREEDFEEFRFDDLTDFDSGELESETENIERKEVTFPDGDKKVFELHMTPFFEDGLDAVLGVAYDVTSLVESQRELEEQKTRIEEFSNIVSHDLRNPLNTAKGYVDLASRSQGAKELEKVEEALGRMEKAIEQLLSTTESSSDPAEMFGLTDAFSEAVSNVPWSPNYQVTSDREIFGSRSGTIRMFESLIRNSVQHNDSSPEIEIGGLRDGFYYTDSGNLEPELEAILPHSSDSGTEGTDIGLTVVDRIASVNGWDTMFENEQGSLRVEVLTDQD